MARRSSSVTAGLVVGVIALAAAAMVAVSLDRPEMPTFPPTPPDPREVGDASVGPITYTVDASDPDRWRFFDFSRGSVVERPGPLEWDLAFRRFTLIVNGGEGFAGLGGAVRVEAAALGEVDAAPDDGWTPTLVRRDSTHAVLDDWYRYGFTTHLLTPKPGVYAVRTADGRYALVESVSYYCPGAQPGCVTFRYVYQGDGSARFSP